MGRWPGGSSGSPELGVGMAEIRRGIQTGGSLGKGICDPPDGSGGVWGSGGSWALPGQPTGCSELGAQGWTWAALQTLEEPGGPWGAHAAAPTPGTVFFQPTKSWARSRPWPALRMGWLWGDPWSIQHHLDTVWGSRVVPQALARAWKGPAPPSCALAASFLPGCARIAAPGGAPGQSSPLHQCWKAPGAQGGTAK